MPSIANASRGARLLALSLLLACATELPAQVLPIAPKLTVSARIKQIELSWSAVPGADRYILWESADGVAPFMPLAFRWLPTQPLAFSKPVAVHRHDWPNARYYVQACNAAGCMASAEKGVAELELDAIGYFKSRNSEAGDGFGYSVAVSGDGRTLVVGAPYEDGSGTGVDARVDEEAPQAGAVYVFTRSGQYWQQQAYIKAPDTAAGDLFGMSVALSADGNTLAVGAPLKLVQVDLDLYSGLVYTFQRSAAGRWAHQATLHASNRSLGDSFGSALALSENGRTLAVAALGEDSNERSVGGTGANDDAPESGAVYIFSFLALPARWIQGAYIKGSSSDTFDMFGASIALSSDGNTLAVGSERDDSYANGDHAAASLCLSPVPPADIACDAGAVDIYSRASGSWEHEAYLRPLIFDALDLFGTAVALSSDGLRLAVGAVGEDSAAMGVDGDSADNSASESGAAYVFARGPSEWEQEAYIKASNPGADDLFGGAVALDDDGSTLAVSARREDSSASGVSDSADDALADAGAVYLFEHSTSTHWTERRYVKSSYPGTYDHFGGHLFHAAIALSGDGDALVVPAPDEDGSGVGVGARIDEAAPEAGAVYLY